MKRKIKKQIKRVVTYTVYEGGMKSLKHKLPKEVERWIARNYWDEMLSRVSRE